MNKVIFGSVILTLLFSNIANAASYLCVGEAGAGVLNTVDNRIYSELVNVTANKFILSDESGEWKVTELGKNNPIFDDCLGGPGYVCVMTGGGYGGAFMRNDNGIFSVTWLGANEKKDEGLYVLKGRCSKFN
ncbi:MAG: hypothetical protein P8H03_01235 [Emcibacteraceae bacterium]|nr:hypothetical protein [Emcibacteraceae bacterium]